MEFVGWIICVKFLWIVLKVIILIIMIVLSSIKLIICLKLCGKCFVGCFLFKVELMKIKNWFVVFLRLCNVFVNMVIFFVKK